MVAGTNKHLEEEKRTAGAAAGLSIGHGIASITSKPRRALTAGNARLVRASMDADLVQYDKYNQAFLHGPKVLQQEPASTRGQIAHSPNVGRGDQWLGKTLADRRAQSKQQIRSSPDTIRPRYSGDMALEMSDFTAGPTAQAQWIAATGGADSNGSAGDSQDCSTLGSHVTWRHGLASGLHSDFVNSDRAHDDSVTPRSLLSASPKKTPFRPAAPPSGAPPSHSPPLPPSPKALEVKPWLEEGTDGDAAHPSEAHASLAHPAAGEEATECSEHEANEEEGKQDGGEVVGEEVTGGSFKSTGQAGDGVERDAPLSSVSKGTPDRLKSADVKPVKVDGEGGQMTGRATRSVSFKGIPLLEPPSFEEVSDPSIDDPSKGAAPSSAAGSASHAASQGAAFREEADASLGQVATQVKGIVRAKSAFRRAHIRHVNEFRQPTESRQPAHDFAIAGAPKKQARPVKAGRAGREWIHEERDSEAQGDGGADGGGGDGAGVSDSFKSLLETLPLDHPLRQGGSLLSLDRTHFHVTVTKGNHLPRKDTVGSCDPFCCVKFAGQTFKTHVASNTLRPQWEDGMDFDTHLLLNSSSIMPLVLELWDYDRGSANELIGTAMLPAERMRSLLIAMEGVETSQTETLIIMEPYEKSNSRRPVPILGEDGYPCQVELELLVYGEPSEKQLLQQHDIIREHDFKEWIWKTCNSNAYGALISISMYEGVSRGLRDCGVMFAITALIQLVFAGTMSDALPSLWDSIHICDSQLLPVAMGGVTVYALLMFDNVPHLVQGFIVAMCARSVNVDGQRRKITPAWWSRAVIAVLGVCVEFCAWMVQFEAGVRFILTSDSRIKMVRSTVALMFIQQVDEMVYRSCSTPSLRRRVDAQKFRVHYGLVFSGIVCESRLYELKNLYSLYVHMPLMVTLSILAVNVTAEFVSPCPDPPFEDRELYHLVQSD